MKKIICSFLLVTITLTLCTPFAFASSNSVNAQILYASGVNDSGSNIYDDGISQRLSNVPVYISQIGTQIHVSATINEKPLSITLDVRGQNNAGNLLYYTSTMNNEEFEVLTAIYFDSFSEAIPIFKDEALRHSHMLRIYLKDTSQLNDYYFIEIYDFELDMFDVILNTVSVCESDYWYAKEFQPIDTIVEKEDKDQEGILPKSTKDYKWTITQVYYDPADLTYNESIVIYLAHDIVDIPRDGTEYWLHTIRVVDKNSICREDSSFNNYGTSCLEIQEPNLRATAPRNTAFFTSKTDGDVYKRPHVNVSVSVAYTLYELDEVNISLGIGLESGGHMDLDSTFKGYVNSDSKGYTRNIDLTLDSTCSLRDVDDYFQVLSSVRDYGKTATTSETCYANWTFSVYNWMNFLTKSYTRTEAFSCKVK